MPLDVISVRELLNSLESRPLFTAEPAWGQPVNSGAARFAVGDFEP